MSDDHHWGDEPDVNGVDYHGGNMTLGALLIFIGLSVALAAGAYYGVRYLYSGLPQRIFAPHHEIR